MSGGIPLNLVYSVLALAALVPAALLPLRPASGGRTAHGRDGVYWLLLLLALAGPAVWALVQTAGGWRTGFSTALWVTVAASLAIYVLVAATAREAWRLAPLLLPYLLVLGALATAWQHGAPSRPLAAPPGAWVQAHIVLSVAAYGLLTIAAIAGLAVLLQERALKAKRPNALTRMLPAAADGERLQLGLLKASAAMLALGLASGMASEWTREGVLLELDHKILLTILAFVVVCLSLAIHYRSGAAGRRLARYLLFAYLLLTLGYPGVKFVTDVVIA